ncbi:MAG: tetratricopeptide repeat protein [Lachnospiraceae bacterium]|nr:tetratricopeptide repeat protein [Lachnospiraceae bacterium]
MIREEDFRDPVCPFDASAYTGQSPDARIPMDRVIEKEDRYLASDDYEGAERHLRYWLAEAGSTGDVRGKLQVLNELMGVLRKAGKEGPAFEAAAQALALAGSPPVGERSMLAASTYVNAATVYKTFMQAEKGIPLFEKALPVFGEACPDGDPRIGGLYNNYALALNDLGRCDEALAYYRKAMERMGTCRDGHLEQAITCLNMCDARMNRDASYVLEDGTPCGPEDPDGYISVPAETDRQVHAWLDEAEALLNRPVTSENGYCAYVYERCADSFDWYGRPAYGADLRRRARRIREAL